MVDVARERKEGMEGEDATEGGAHFQLGFVKFNCSVCMNYNAINLTFKCMYFILGEQCALHIMTPSLPQVRRAAC